MTAAYSQGVEVITRHAGESFTAGDSLLVTVTDIDPAGVRLVAEGAYIGGAKDGERFRSTHEIGPGGSVRLGDLLTVVLLEIQPRRCRLGALAPPHLPVRPQELRGA